MFKIYLLLCIPFAALGYVMFFWKWKKNPQNFYSDKEPFIFGHRGSPTHITENTIASFEKAIEQGVDGLELDVRLSKDKKLVIFHDADLQRLAGINKKIKHLRFNEIQEIVLEQAQKKIDNAKADIEDLKQKIQLLNNA